MYRHLFWILTLCFLLVGCGEDPEVERTKRVSETEEVAKQMNDNILSIITILQAAENQWVINDVKPILLDGVVVGYTFYFDGQDPVNVFLELYMADKNSYTYLIPLLGIEFYDNAWFWTLNGDLLTDGNGDPIPVIPDDPNNPIIPQIMIVDDYWCISIDGGETWQQIFSITEKIDTPIVESEKLHDDIFQNIEFDGENFYVTVVDGQVMVIPHDCSIDDLPAYGTKVTPDTEDEEDPIVVEGGAIKAEFSVSANKKVYFSQGNLQEYVTNTSSSIAEFGERRFALNQYDVCVSDGLCPFEDPYFDSYWEEEDDRKEVSGWVDMFIRGGADIPVFYQYIYTEYELFRDAIPYSGNVDYSNLNISNGSGTWRTLSYDEWQYLINERDNAEKLRSLGTINSKVGYIFLPDKWKLPKGQKFTAQAPNSNTNTYSVDDWKKMENRGAVFLPTTGMISDWEYISGRNTFAHYWSSTFVIEDDEIICWNLQFNDNGSFFGMSTTESDFLGAVRLVKDTE